MAWGTGTTVDDAEVYGGQPADPGDAFEGMNQEQIGQSPINLGNKFSLEESTPNQPLNDYKENNKLS